MDIPLLFFFFMLIHEKLFVAVHLLISPRESCAPACAVQLSLHACLLLLLLLFLMSFFFSSGLSCTMLMKYLSVLVYRSRHDKRNDMSGSSQ